MSVEEPEDHLTTDDVVRSIREVLRLERERDQEPRGTSRFRELTVEIARRTRRLWHHSRRSA